MGKTASKKSQHKNVSLMPVWELSAHVIPYVAERYRAAELTGSGWDVTTWVAPIEGLSLRQIDRIMKHESPLVGLNLVDLVLHAMNKPELLHTFTFVPGHVDRFATEMAYEEYMAVYDEEPPVEFLARRSQELKALRQRVLAEASVRLNR